MKDRRDANSPGAFSRGEAAAGAPRLSTSPFPGESDAKKGAVRTVAVVGGGAAGMIAAISAAEAGPQVKVTVFDKNPLAGRKLGLTGKGRCNLTNRCTVPVFLENLLRGGRFLHSAARCFPPEAVMAYFEEVLHVPLKTERGNRVFPCSDRAGDVVYALVRRMRSLGCEYRTDPVTALIAEKDGRLRGIATAGSRGALLPFDRVILCTGGASYPSTGSTGDGARLCAALGMEVSPLLPSLVPLVIEEDCCREMQGLSLRNISLRLLDGDSGKTLYEEQGEMLFTHFGVSGPLVLSASAHLPEKNRPGRCRIELDLKPGLDRQTLDRRLQSDFQKYSNRDFRNALSDLLPAGMIPVMVRLSGIPGEKKVHSILREERARLLQAIKRFPLTVRGTRPLSEAIITRGGVSLKEIDPRSMAAKRFPGLYVAGEALDADAYTGGFNLQIAFCTGRLAGKKAAEE